MSNSAQSRSHDYPENGADSYLVIALGRLTSQSDAWTALEAKANIFLVIALAEITLLIAVSSIDRTTNSSHRTIAIVFVAVSIFLAVALMAVSILVLRIMIAKTFPEPLATYSLAKMHRHEANAFTWDIARTLDQAHSENMKALERKKWGVVVCQSLVVALTVSVMVASASWLTG